MLADCCATHGAYAPFIDPSRPLKGEVVLRETYPTGLRSAFNSIFFSCELAAGVAPLLG